MLISHKHKFIFIHVWKTGGTSIYEAMLPYVESVRPPRGIMEWVLGKKTKAIFSDFEKHITRPELKEQLNEDDFNQYFKFAFVRNPLSWEVSYYHFITQYPNNHPRKEVIRKLGSFEAFIDWAYENEMKKHSQSQFIVDESGNRIVDFVGKYENFLEDLDRVRVSLNLPILKLEHVNKTTHKDYMRYYNSRTEAIVRDVLKEDFELFNYS